VLSEGQQGTLEINVGGDGLFKLHRNASMLFTHFAYCVVQDGRPTQLSLILYSIKVDTLSRLGVQILFPYSAAAYLTVPGVLIPMNMKTLQWVRFTVTSCHNFAM
jgi:hypothetical protein